MLVRPSNETIKQGSGQDRDAVMPNEIGEDAEVHENMGEPEAAELDEEEETQPVRALSSPNMPTVSEVREHEIDHIPFRNWCKACIEGFGQERGHMSIDAEARQIPIISFDYVLLTARGAFTRQEYAPLEGEDSLKILVVKDGKTKCLFAHGVPVKGVDPKRYVVDEVVKDVLWLGHSRVIL